MKIPGIGSVEIICKECDREYQILIATLFMNRRTAINFCPGCGKPLDWEFIKTQNK